MRALTLTGSTWSGLPGPAEEGACACICECEGERENGGAISRTISVYLISIWAITPSSKRMELRICTCGKLHIRA